MRVAVDCRYVRERPSGIGAYVEALVTRLPSLAPGDRFLFWAHRRAHHPLSGAPNVEEVVVAPEPNALGPLLWPTRYAPFEDVGLFHAAHTILPRGIPAPTVVTVHDLLAIEHPRLHRSGLDGFAKRLYYPRAVRWALERATRLVTTTAAMADQVARQCPSARSRTVVVPLGVDDEFRPAADRDAARARVQRLLGTTDPYFLVVGQNSRTKQHRAAVAAFAAVDRPCRLVLLQRQTARNPLAAFARRLGIEDRVIWLSHVGREELIALLQAATALVQPSTYEGFGLPVLEAMACGCPVVASDIPTLREVVGDGGVLVPPLDLERLGAAMRAVAGSRGHRAELAGRARERADRFSWDRCVRETLEVYRSACG